MANILVDDLPTTVLIDHTEYKIETDFKACLRTILAFEDNTLTPQEKYIVLLTNLFPVIPTDTQYAVVEAMRFLNGGDEHEEKESPRVYSFAKDARFIYAAFKQTHGIDLNSAQLHWWQFLALFMDLGQDTTFCQLTALRKRIKTGKATKEEKQAAREMGDLFDIEEIDTRTLSEKEREAEFLRLVDEQKTKKV